MRNFLPQFSSQVLLSSLLLSGLGCMVGIPGAIAQVKPAPQTADQISKPQPTIEDYRQKIKAAQASGDRVAEGNALEGLGMLYKAQSDSTKAIDYFQKSLAIWQGLKDRSRIADLLLTLGHTYEERGGIFCDKAISYYEQSLPILQEIKNQTSESIVLGRMGRCYESRGEYKKAIESLEKGLLMARASKHQQNEAIILLDLAKAYQEQDEKDNKRWDEGVLSTDFRKSPQSIVNATKAWQSAQQGLAIAQALKNPELSIRALETLGRSYAVLQEYPKAIEAQRQRLKIVSEYTDTALSAQGFNALGNLYAAQGNHAAAIEHHQAAVEIYRRRQENWLASLPPSTNPARLNLPHYELRQALIYLGDAHEISGDYGKAVTAYQEAFGSLEEFQKRFGHANSDIILLRKWGYALAKFGKLPEAESILRLAIRQGEIFRLAWPDSDSYSSGWVPTDADRIRFAERQTYTYQQLQQVLVRQGKTDAALEMADESRARHFVELLSHRLKDKSSQNNTPLPNALKLAEIRQIAQTQNATLVQYSFVASDLLYIWVIKPDGRIAFQSVNLQNSPIKQLITKSRQALGVRSRSRSAGGITPKAELPNPILQQLHQVLIAPIAAELPTDPNQRVVFLPQNELFLVPFAALPNVQGQYLIERHTLSIAPSVQTLSLTQAQAKKVSPNGRSLVVGNPVMPMFEGEPLTNLPGAQTEAMSIANLLNTSPLVGAQATKAAVLQQMSSASVLHFATHGLLDTLQGDMPGALAFSPSGNDNGFLTASEIFDLKLNANLVVLSACDTGKGKITGDGVVGLSRSFVAAGVPSVVVSLWAVDDQSTSFLMTEFYRQLKTNPNKAVALRQAMLATMKQHPHPVDWSAFTLVGEAE